MRQAGSGRGWWNGSVELTRRNSLTFRWLNFTQFVQEAVLQDLLRHEIVTEKFGGDTLAVQISALYGRGLDKLQVFFQMIFTNLFFVFLRRQFCSKPN
jgi:hypothetical protein